jgi:RNA polymerase sigma factor (TIGR02999 family)
MNQITRILNDIKGGHPSAAGELLPLVYEELRRVAAAKVARERAGQTLQATELVHEAYLRLLGPDQQLAFENRRHFFAAAAEAMRRILIDRARQKASAKRGGDAQRVELSDHPDQQPDGDLVALDEAMNQLASEDALAAKVVELRQFAGLGHEQVAAALNITVYQARQKWTYARAWLRAALGD